MSRILLVTIILTGRTGTEIVCCETARGLRRRGHDVIIYTQQDGRTAQELRAEGFEVTTDLSSIARAPEIIQANQTVPLIEAVGRFPAAPAISICHDATTWHSEPIELPSIRRQVAVDLACRDRIAKRIPHGQIEILRNAVDLDSFQSRAPLPQRPNRALVLAKHPSYLDAIRDACAQRGLELSVVGPAAGNVVDDLPAYFRAHDLVFASARSALEAMAAGCAVIVLDWRGFAGLVTHDAVSSWRQNNFGHRLLSRPVTTELILDAIDHYDAGDAQSVSHFIRENSSLDAYLDRLEVMHREVIAEGAAKPVDKDELLYRMGLSLSAIESAWRVQMAADFAQFARSKHDELAAIFLERGRVREAELRAEFRQQMSIREAELLERTRATEAEAQAREAELQRQASLKEAEFAAFRAWAAPRNLPRRILRRMQRNLLGR